MPRLNITPLNDGIARVIHTMQAPADTVDNRCNLTPATQRALPDFEISKGTNGDFDVEQLKEVIGNAPAVETLECPECYGCFTRGLPCCPYCRAPAAKQARRIRSRHKPLTADDIVEGGVYVPKKGNNKTPNFRVTDIDYAEATEFGALLSYEREGVEDSDASCSVPEFLALVARRADA